MAVIDVITVVYDRTTHLPEAHALTHMLAEHEGERVTHRIVMNEDNAEGGYAAACNEGARHGGSPVIGFLNPDVQVLARFSHLVLSQLTRPRVVITGNRFGKPVKEVRQWGCRDWVCGATFFVARDWFERVGGFDPAYVWSWEETDLIRRAQSERKLAVHQELPLRHASPDPATDPHNPLKQRLFREGRVRFAEKWS